MQVWKNTLQDRKYIPVRPGSTCEATEVLETTGRGRVDGAALVLPHQDLPVPPHKYFLPQPSQINPLNFRILLAFGYLPQFNM
jgi:hypothetical protein